MTEDVPVDSRIICFAVSNLPGNQLRRQVHLKNLNPQHDFKSKSEFPKLKLSQISGSQARVLLLAGLPVPMSRLRYTSESVALQ